MLGLLLMLSPTLSQTSSLIAQIAGIFLLIGIGALVYLLAARLLNHPDLKLLLRTVKA